MDRRALMTAGAAALAAAATVPMPARAASNQNIVGSWLGTITAVAPPLGQFNDLISFHPGGVVTESRRYLIPATPLGPLLETTGHGAWEQRSHNGFEVFFRFLLQDANTGAPVGTDNIRLWLTLERGVLQGTFESQVKNTADAVLLTVTGNYAATPITV